MICVHTIYNTKADSIKVVNCIEEYIISVNNNFKDPLKKMKEIKEVNIVK